MNHAQLVTLSAEITVDPLTRGYAAMSDLEVATSLNTKNRPVTDIPIEDIIKFLLLDNTYKTDDGSDLQDRSIWQRMKEVVNLADTPTAAVANPWGSSSLGNVTEIQQIKTHQLYDYFTLMAQGDLSVDLTDSNFKSYLSGAQGAGCMSEAQETVLLALGNNLQTRAAELGLPTIYEGNVSEVRA